MKTTKTITVDIQILFNLAKLMYCKVSKNEVIGINDDMKNTVKETCQKIAELCVDSTNADTDFADIKFWVNDEND